MLEKNYDFATAEPRIAKSWDDADAFKAGAGAKPDAQPFTIVIPPPNVTGSLHMGHALNNTLQDIMVRFERMRGKNVLWQPGMDHAGIATQMVVERQLMENQQPGRRDLGREKFVEKIWEWKEESGGIIFNQLKRLGASCDWSRERFTMDEGLSKAVLEVFVTLYKEGLIYRGKRLVNWDPKFETAISDLEVENTEVNGHMWHFKYPLAGGETYEYVEKDEDGNVTLRETRDFISIATTRPETMLGDGAVAVHPSDERYASIVGKLCEIPVGPKEHRRLIPIIIDDYPDPDFGSGAVKITGAHDFNDYMVAKRNEIPCYRLMDVKAAMRDDGNSYEDSANFARMILDDNNVPSENFVDTINLVPDIYRGLDRFEARKRIVADINADELAVTVTDDEGNAVPFVENKKIMQPFGDRSHVVIEPMLTDQWFVDAETLAKPAIASVKEGRTNFVPKTWENTYFHWMNNIQPWCISRQLWWGHRIPAWYGPEPGTDAGGLDWVHQHAFVAKSEMEVLQLAKILYSEKNINVPIFLSKTEFENVHNWHEINGGLYEFEPDQSLGELKAILLEQDEDVLDTWFSSALWPFSTLGWPDQTKALDTYYQTDVLVTGLDIIFFWVARMMMMGLHFMKDEDGTPIEPFHTVYVHALVRDKTGAKMSKSKGNVIDPLELMDEYGTDALRFTLAIMAAQGRDVKLDTARIAGYRNFGTKLWNATRFAEMNGVVRGGNFAPSDAKLTVNRWILTELSRTTAEITTAIEKFRFNDAAASAYKFVWNQTCDWYLELLKPIFSGEDEAAKAEAQACAGYVLDEIYKLLHPFMPFMTEELWADTIEGDRPTLLCHAEWPQGGFTDNMAADEINWLIELVSEIRSVRSEMNIKPGLKLPMVVTGASDETIARLSTHDAAIKTLARMDAIEIGNEVPKASAQLVQGEATIYLPLEGIIDLAAEVARLTKEQGALDKDIKQLTGKLANERFVANAPAEVVQENRERLSGAEAKREKIVAALERMG